MKTGFRRTWRNHTGNQRCQPAEVRRPATLGEIVEAVRDAEGAGLTVRAVGSGHSWSDAALTTGILLLPQGLAGPLPLEPELLRADVDARRLARTGSGTRVRELNARLEAEGRALSNMGGYDGQTIAGVLSTSTHGSGLRFGPLADMARSLELVCSGGRLLRVERANGPTDARAFARARPGWELVQDDEVFDAAVVGMGCMGVLYAVTLEVRDAFWLKEVRTMSTWEAERERLGERLREEEHLELFVNPYANADGVHACIVTTRTEVPRPPRGHAQHKLERNPLIELLAQLPFTAPVLRAILDLSPRATPRQLDKALAGLRDDEYTNRSYRVFNIGAANHLPAYSSEIGVPLGRHVEAVDRLLEVAAARARAGHAYHSSPFSLRFVRRTTAFLSMMEGADTMMIELIMQTGTEGGFELLAAHEDALYELGGRPHWGQVNTLTEPALRMLYPQLDRWLAVRRELDATGVFSSPFTKRVGLSTVGYAHA
ncbi:MAG: D-arabinono-1,4-lactone oxidase [Solirubrobacteraceae bacterium]